MLKIGDFSKLAHVTVKTLRHYDRLGLLKPVFTDRFTGYRYYALGQLPRLNRILALKDLGFSLDQVSQMLDDDLPLEHLRRLFNQKREELQERLLAEQDRLGRVAQRLRQIEQEGRLPDYEVTLKSVPAQTIASLRLTIPTLEELAEQCSRTRAQVRTWAAWNGLRSRDQWLLLYHHPEYRERNLDVEVALVVEEAGAVSQSVQPAVIGLRRLPAVDTMASMLHTVCEHPLDEAYPQLFTWAERNGYVVTGPARELDLYDPTHQPDTRSFTEIQLPVESMLLRKKQWINNPNRKEEEMEPKFVELPAFKVVGMRYYGKNENQEISQLWGEADRRFGEIGHVTSHEQSYGVCIMVPGAAPGEFEYVAGLEVSSTADLPAGMVARDVPAARYAVFTHVGSLEALKDTYHYIYHVWLPQSGYEPAGGLDFELYNADFKNFAPDSRHYIYVPLK